MGVRDRNGDGGRGYTKLDLVVMGVRECEVKGGEGRGQKSPIQRTHLYWEGKED